MDIGLNANQADRQVKNIQDDIVLSKGFKMISIPIRTKNWMQKRDSVCLDIKYLPIWLSKINIKSLNTEQYKKYIEILNWSLSDDFDSYKTPTQIFSFETELRDEIYDNGYFNDIKIIGKEIVYDFGRIDLLGIDDKNNKICIELKKYKEFSDTKDQLLKYQNSKLFSRIIYCAYEIDDSFKNWCEKNSIDVYTYVRELNFTRWSMN